MSALSTESDFLWSSSPLTGRSRSVEARGALNILDFALSKDALGLVTLGFDRSVDEDGEAGSWEPIRERDWGPSPGRNDLARVGLWILDKFSICSCTGRSQN